MIFSYLNCLFNFSKQRSIKIQIRRKSWSILFFGNDDFSVFSLKVLHHCWQRQTTVSKLEVVTTVTSKPNPVYRFASENNLCIRQWPPVLDANSAYDVGVVVSFGYLIPKKLIDAFPLGMINVHASLLPRWRGASPIIHAIMMGDSETGISIMRIKPHHFDTGDVIMQKACSIGPNELMPSLYSRLGNIGAGCLMETLAALPECLENSIPQCDSLVTYAPRIKPELSIIKWTEQTAEQVFNLYRSLYGFLVIQASWHGQQVKIKEIRKGAESCDVSQEPGAVRWHRSCRELRIHCKTGYIIIDHMTVGGKRLKGIDFYNGYLTRKPRNQWFFS